MSLIPRYHEVTNEIEIWRTRTLYTDGSYDHGVAGWAVVENGECIFSDWGRGVTSNMAEGYAIIEALRIVGDARATIISDSQAWVNAITHTKRLRGKGSRMILDEALNLINPKINLRWIPSHSGYHGNELADSHAREARLVR